MRLPVDFIEPTPECERIVFAFFHPVKRRPSKPQPANPGAIESSSAGWYGRADLWIYVVLFVTVIAVYSQVHLHEFINYDDPVYVTENAQVRNGVTGPAWFGHLPGRTMRTGSR